MLAVRRQPHPSTLPHRVRRRPHRRRQPPREESLIVRAVPTHRVQSAAAVGEEKMRDAAALREMHRPARPVRSAWRCHRPTESTPGRSLQAASPTAAARRHAERSRRTTRDDEARAGEIEHRVRPHRFLPRELLRLAVGARAIERAAVLVVLRVYAIHWPSGLHAA